LGLVLIVALGAGGLSWRLSQGPLDLPWFKVQLEVRLNQEIAPARVGVQSAALAWEGFEKGLGSPFDLRLTGVTLSDPSRPASGVTIPSTRVTVALLPLLAGRIELRRVEVERPTITVRRAGSGTPNVFLGPAGSGARDAVPMLAPVIEELGRPARQTGGPIVALRELEEIRIRDAHLTIQEDSAHRAWHVPKANFDLVRAPQGGVQARAEVDLRLGDRLVPISSTATIPQGRHGAEAAFRVGVVQPAALAGVRPELKFLDNVHMPLSGWGRVALDPDLAVVGFDAAVQAGAGEAEINGLRLAVASASLRLHGTARDVAVDEAQVVLSPPGFAPLVTVTAAGSVRPGKDRTEADFSLNVDAVRFVDLAALWPPGLAEDARRWVVANITDGVARDGHFEFNLSADPGLSDVRITQASGTARGEGLTVHWLRPMPPAVDGNGSLQLLNPDALEVTISGARQAPEVPGGPGLVYRRSNVRITGLEQHEQIAFLDLSIAGSVPGLVALLNDPKLNLLSRGGVVVRDPAGQFAGMVRIAVPMTAHVTMDQVRIGAHGQVSGLRLSDVMAGQTLSGGTFELAADNKGLTMDGQAALNNLPARIGAAMDFRGGPPTQVLRTVKISAVVDAGRLAAYGLDAGGFVTGSLPVSATVTEQRNGVGHVAAQVDLGGAGLGIAPLAWRKPEGVPAIADFDLLLNRDRLERIDPIRVSGPNLLFEGYARFQHGQLAAIRADRVTLGRTEAQASVMVPPSGGPMDATISGSVLDLSGRFGRGSSTQATEHDATGRGPAWQARVRFDTVILAQDEALHGFAGYAQDDGEVLRDVRLQATTGPDRPLLAVIAPDAGGRSVKVTAADAGALMRALNLGHTIDGGRLSVSAQYLDSQVDSAGGRPLSGRAEMDDFRVLKGAGFGKLLQALTVYGLADVMKGPGVSFTRLVAPFAWRDGVLNLSDARAFSASLGLTAVGNIDFDTGTVNVNGTIVPAYFFNSLLGRVPVIGRLFSPERGGGLIAASYSVTGQLTAPAVRVNPLTALAPGFVRGVFGGANGGAGGKALEPEGDLGMNGRGIGPGQH
jgi:hypothetical protein